LVLSKDLKEEGKKRGRGEPYRNLARWGRKRKKKEKKKRAEVNADNVLRELLHQKDHEGKEKKEKSGICGSRRGEGIERGRKYSEGRKGGGS